MPFDLSSQPSPIQLAISDEPQEKSFYVHLSDDNMKTGSVCTMDVR